MKSWISLIIGLTLGSMLEMTILNAIAQQPAQCSPDQVSQLEFSLGATLQAKASAEARVRQLETELASVKKELDGVKNPKPKEKTDAK